MLEVGQSILKQQHTLVRFPQCTGVPRHSRDPKIWKSLPEKVPRRSSINKPSSIKSLEDEVSVAAVSLFGLETVGAGGGHGPGSQLLLEAA